MNSHKRIYVYGHVSAQPQAVANLFGAQLANEIVAESDLAIFAINPAAGIDQKTIDQWQALSDYQLPRLVVVNELDGSDADFEDASNVHLLLGESGLLGDIVPFADAGFIPAARVSEFVPLLLQGLACLR